MNTYQDNNANKYTPKQGVKKTYITGEQLKAIAIHAPKNAVALFQPYINEWLPVYGITTPEQISAYLAQVLHESGHFRYSKEIWGPTKQQRRYERDFSQPFTRDNDRNSLAFDLGNANAGDGKFFMGRGAIQTTGRANYKKVSIHLFNDDRLLKSPQLLEIPEYSIRASMYYFTTRVMGKVEDLTDVTAVTKKVNGGTNGLEYREENYIRAIDVLV